MTLIRFTRLWLVFNIDISAVFDFQQPAPEERFRYSATSDFFLSG